MDRVRLKILGLSYSMSQSGAYALVLSDLDDTYRIPIIIGISEAQSIAIQLEHLQTQRPLTHDLVKRLTDGLNVTLEEIFIYRWEAGIFYSELLFKQEEKELRIDARTSDAVALALRYGCPIYTTPEVVEKTSISVPEKEMLEQEVKANDLEPAVTESNQELSVEELTRLMEEAVKNEDYENASRFRDMLKAKNSD
ncbi:bifunctional nuclease family protein [uncultured Sanguibacteroides sp.]|uniref:bifunctional nuclease family protein n=1 Tax=uncultured Sanguibacteroides sp. TaxID=1635151 RepID=UPI0025F32D4A|nr:bifunctional nuclease family protein [uncultured Sanguibacteroides sp.]